MIWNLQTNILLLKEMKAKNVLIATFGEISSSWEDLADTLKEGSPSMFSTLSGRGAREHWELLKKEWLRQDKSNRKRSGNDDENYSVFDALMQELVDDEEMVLDERAKEKRIKKEINDKKESDGRTIREIATERVPKTRIVKKQGRTSVEHSHSDRYYELEEKKLAIEKLRVEADIKERAEQHALLIQLVTQLTQKKKNEN